ncbi:Mediator of RNA polymerase II transcription subunit 17 [Aphelenchoides bicaudatus]|nr:Mediator of RNA polymerase II transcription subunit 17 [Aphelenchoides bicaudatus]
MQSANGFEAGSSRGVNVAVEPQSEWQISYIQYDGTECFIPPPNFADIVAKNVSKIQWQDIIENSTALENDEQEDVVSEETKKLEKDLLAFDSVREAARERIVPTAGPWTDVAKHLHESLQEVNVLLDTLRIAKTQYLNVLQVAQPNEDNRPPELLNKAKSFLWVSRRKAFSEALNILEVASKARQNNNTEDRPLYFSELKAMREKWRIRKINDFIFGDLGYRIYGPKFAQGEIFDVFWEPKQSSSGSRSSSRRCIQVQVPKNLMRRTKLTVSLIKDESESQEKIYTSTDQTQPVQYAESSRNIPWETTLKWAQESLMNRDIFTQLMKEAIDEKHVCVVTENTIAVDMLGGMLLKFERHFYPFQEMEIPQTGDPYLTSLLHDYFVRDITRPPHRPQQFVGLPITSLPENLDLRGPQGVSVEEIVSRMDKHVPLLTRMIEAANRYALVDQTVKVLDQQMLCRDDPQFTWRWIRCTATFSMINGTFTNRCYDNLGKVAFTIKIGADEVLVVTKDNLIINCHRQTTLLQETLNLMSSTCQLSSAALLAKLYCWQNLHTNTNAFCKEGTPTPTFYACNQVATKKLFIQFFTDGRPYQMRVACVSPPQNGTSAESKHEDASSYSNNFNDHMEDANDSQLNFVKINNDRIPGESFLRKLDYVYTMFST